MGSQEFSNAPSNAEGRGAIEGPGMEEEPLMPRVNVASRVGRVLSIPPVPPRDVKWQRPMGPPPPLTGGTTTGPREARRVDL